MTKEKKEELKDCFFASGVVFTIVLFGVFIGFLIWGATKKTIVMSEEKTRCEELGGKYSLQWWDSDSGYTESCVKSFTESETLWYRTDVK